MPPRILALYAALTLAPLATTGQPLPKDAPVPLQVRQGQGEFAKKLQGVVLPTGKGWKAVTDRHRRVQVMLPDKWVVDASSDGDVLIRAVPPGNEKVPKAVFMLILREPSDADPLEIDERTAAAYVNELADQPDLKRLQFKPTDSGLVVARGLKFALAGGTMMLDKKQFQQQQLVYIAEDRIVSIQFAAVASEFPKYADEVAKIFASYDSLALRLAQ